MEEKNLEVAISYWLTECSINEAQKEWPILLEAYGCSPVIGYLAANMWDQQENILSRIPTAQSGRTVKRIGVYYFRLRNGGIERCISQLIPLWQNMGYEVILLTEEKENDEDYPIQISVKRILIPPVQVSQKEKYMERAVAWKQIIEDWDLDTIAYEAWDSPFLFWDACVIKGAQCNLLVHVHGTYSYLFRAQLPYRHELLNSYKLVDYAVVLSTLFEEFWSSFCPAKYIPNKVELCDKTEMSSLDGQNVLWVGRISAEKRPVDALQAFALVLKECPNAHLTIVGETNTDEIKDAVEQTIQALELEKHITLTGFQKDVMPYYHKADVLLFTSEFEGFGFVLAESKSHGLPIVMYDLPYLELVKDNRGIITVPQGDIMGLARQVSCLLAEGGKEKRKKLGRDARASVESFAAITQEVEWENVFTLLEKPRMNRMANIRLDQEVITLLLQEDQKGHQQQSVYQKQLLEGKNWLEKQYYSQGRIIREMTTQLEMIPEPVKKVFYKLNKLRAGEK